MKRHNFKVGDKLESSSGTTCTVARIDPACNNIYAKDFSNYRPDGDEISSPHIWRVIKSAAPVAMTRASDFIDSYNKFEVTILRKRTDAPFTFSGFGATFVHRATVTFSTAAAVPYADAVREYLREVGQTLGAPDDYLAIAVYGDNDTLCAEFSTKTVEQPIAVDFVA